MCLYNCSAALAFRLMPPSIFTLIEPRWIVPVIPSGAVLTDHAVVVQNELIKAVLPTGEARARYPSANITILPEHVLMPGLINAHVHSAMTLLRGFADDLSLMAWLEDYIWPVEGAHVDETFVFDGTLLAAAEMLSTGTTCAVDSYFFPEAAARAFSQAGIRAQVNMPVIQFPTAWAQTEAEHITKGLAFHDSIRADPLITTAFAPHSPYTVTDETFRRIETLAQELELAIHLHLHETADEISQGRDRHGKRPYRHMVDLGLAGPHLQTVHMTQLESQEIDDLALHGIHVAHCPESNMKLASGVCPAAQLLAAGVNIALGTDGAASNNNLDMFGTMRAAALLAKVAGEPTDLPAWQVLEAATLGGARMLAREAELGSIEPGKRADLTAVDLSGPTTQPVYDPISTLVYAASGADVSHTWVGGQAVYALGRTTNIDYSSLLKTIKGWGRRISSHGDGA